MIGSTHRLNIGKYVVVIFCDSQSTRQASALFPNTDKVLLESSVRALGYDPDVLQSSMNIPYIRTPDTQILIDTGLGPGRSQLPQTMAWAGIEINRIEHVIISHAHGDHIGGLVDANGSLMFPRARYYVWHTEWEAWQEAADKPENAESVVRKTLLAIKDKVTLVKDDGAFLPGISAVPTPGHTRGHMAVMIESEGERLLHLVDAIHHPSQVAHPEWSPGFDSQPDLSATTRTNILKRAAADDLLTLAYHFPFPGLGKVARDGSQNAWQPIA
ncbi:MAG: MBL fold metallo-hydrolase [Anaerolineae bacterium]